jgi:kynurenine 3-monooxygenase
VAPLLTQLTQSFIEKPTGMFLTTRVRPWYSGGHVVLLGDACHTVVPFYGQGMNAAFEDCIVLDECLERHPDDYEAAFAEHQSLRKRHTDALADLSVRNFYELRDKVRLPTFIARKQVEHVFERVFPRSWIPLYTLISHMTIPYADAIERYDRQRRMARWLGADLMTLAVASGLVCRDFARRAFGTGGRLLAAGEAPEPRGEGAKPEELRRLKNLPPANTPRQV